MPESHEPIDWRALDRYLAGEGSPSERDAMRQRIAENPTLAALVSLTRSLPRRTGSDEHRSRDLDAAWTSLRQKAGIGEFSVDARQHSTPDHERRLRVEATLVPFRNRRRYVRAGPRYAAAAIASAVIIGAFVVFSPRMKGRVSHTSRSRIRSEFSTSRGQRATIELLDGTRVWLAPATRLQVATFDAPTRDIYLSGEAVFDVKHMSDKPLVVHAAGVLARDIGTRFGVRALSTDSVVRVVVASGAVSLQSDSTRAVHVSRVVVQSGMLGIVGSSPDVRLTTGVNVAQYLGWTDGRIEFVRSSLGEALPELSRWFDIDIRLGSPSLAKRTLTASFADDALPDVLAVLEGALDVRAIRDGNQITLYPRQP